MEEEKTGFFAEFKKFIARGNVMDMAVGVIIGAAFKAIVDSLVNDILMPLVGIFAGQDTFASLFFNVGGAEIKYGNFISAVLNFFIMALVIFTIVRSINKANEKLESMLHKPKDEAEQEKEPEEETPPEPTEAELLAAILEELRKKNA